MIGKSSLPLGYSKPANACWEATSIKAQNKIIPHFSVVVADQNTLMLSIKNNMIKEQYTPEYFFLPYKHSV